MFDEVELCAKRITGNDVGFIIDALPALLDCGGIDTLSIAFNFLDVLIETRAHRTDLVTNEADVVRMLDQMTGRVESSSGLVPLQKVAYLELLGTAGLTFGSDLFFPRYVRAALDAHVTDASPSELRQTFVWWPTRYYGDYATAVSQLTECLRNPRYTLAHAYQALLLAATEERPVAAIGEEFDIDRKAIALIEPFERRL